jgi:hypothetical protein
MILKFGALHRVVINYILQLLLSSSLSLLSLLFYFCALFQVNSRTLIGVICCFLCITLMCLHMACFMRHRMF